MRYTLILFLVLTGIGGLYWSQQIEERGFAQSSEKEAEEVRDAFQLDREELDRSETAGVVSYANVIDEAKPAVVTVASASIVRTMHRRGGISPMEEFLRRFYGVPGPGGGQAPQQGEEELEERRVPNGMGSGVIISSDGYVLTNNHVVSEENGDQADEIEVTLTSGRTFDAEVVGRDPRTDVALLKIEGEDLPFLKMADSEMLRVGDVVFAIGNPLGLSQTVTMGIVSATGRSQLGILGQQGYEDFIQTDASINPGNSGGALIDARGRLVGINTAIFSRTGGNIGIGFAIPITLARSIVLDLLETGGVQRGFLGVSIRDLSPDLAEAFGLDRVEGALVENVQEGLPAQTAGIRRGDVIVGVDDHEVDDVNDLRLTIAQHRPGTTVEIAVIRDGNEKLYSVTLGSLEEAFNGGSAPGKELLEGVTLQPLTEELKAQWQTEELEGLVVTEVDGRSPFARTLVAGTVILEVNSTKVKTLEEASEALRSGANRLYVSFRGNRGYVALRLP